MPAYMAYLLARCRRASANPGCHAAGQHRLNAVYAGLAGIAPPGKSQSCHCCKGMGKPYVIANPGQRNPPFQRARFTIRRLCARSYCSASWHSAALYSAGGRDGQRPPCFACLYRLFVRPLASHRPVVQPYWYAFLRRPPRAVLMRQSLVRRTMEGMAGFEPATCWVVVP